MTLNKEIKLNDGTDIFRFGWELNILRRLLSAFSLKLIIVFKLNYVKTGSYFEKNIKI